MADGDQVTHGDGSDPPLTGAAGDPAWDDWQTPLNAPAIPVLHLDGFDGPMDLLLDLAERQRIDLGRMSVLALAEQFVAAMAQLVDRVTLEQRADWLVMATRLVLLRSRLLFPASPEAAAEAERDATAELRRIDALAHMRAAANWLQARPQLGQDIFARPAAKAPPSEGGYVALMEACLVVLRGRGGRPEEAPVYQMVVPDLWRVSDALDRIREMLAAHPEGGAIAAFLPILSPDAPHRALQARAATASTFLAGLELAREGGLTLDQDLAFGAVHISSTQVVSTATAAKAFPNYGAV